MAPPNASWYTPLVVSVILLPVAHQHPWIRIRLTSRDFVALALRPVDNSFNVAI